MYSEKLENLITLALADGVLTDKKKQVLLSSAAAEGIDPNEFEMVLDGRVYERQKNDNSAAELPVNKQVEAEKKTSVHALFQLLNEEEEISNRTLEAKIKQLQKEYDRLTVKNVAKFAGVVAKELIPGYGIAKEILGGSDDDDDENEFENKVAALQHSAAEKLISKEKSIISTFPIPTAKDEVIEFLSNAISRAKQEISSASNSLHNALTSTWKMKCEQTIRQARLSLKNDVSAMATIEEFAKQFNAANELSEKLERIVYEGTVQEKKKKKILREQRECIKNFPIPKTSEDILELLQYILPKAKTGFNSDKNVLAWRGKFKDVLSMAKVVCANDAKTKSEIELLAQQNKTSILPFLVSWYMQLSLMTKIISGIVIVGILSRYH